MGRHTAVNRTFVDDRLADLSLFRGRGVWAAKPRATESAARKRRDSIRAKAADIWVAYRAHQRGAATFKQRMLIEYQNPRQLGQVRPVRETYAIELGMMRGASGKRFKRPVKKTRGGFRAARTGLYS
jgi:hypothetical protein